MKISEVITKINGDMKVPDVAKQLGVSKETLSRRLKSVGYEYDNKGKTYSYKGKPDDKNKVDNTEFSTLLGTKIVKKSDKNNIKVSENIDEDNANVVKKEEITLTDEEKLFVKELCKSESEIRLMVDFSMLPLKKKTKKHQIEISEGTFNDFEEFAKKMKDKRFSKNDLIEIALVRFMREFGR